MAHGSKKWISDWRGRLKRSRHCTWLDRRAEFASSHIRYWRCADCDDLPPMIGGWFHCRTCVEQQAGLDVRWTNKHTDTRRMELQKRRNIVRNLMRRAKYVPELYDYIPTKHKNGWLD